MPAYVTEIEIGLEPGRRAEILDRIDVDAGWNIARGGGKYGG